MAESKTDKGDMLKVRPKDLPEDILKLLEGRAPIIKPEPQESTETPSSLECQYCGAMTNSSGEQFSDKRSLVGHERYCTKNPDRIESFGATLRSWEEKGHTIVGTQVQCKWCGQIFNTHGMISHSAYHKRKISGNGGVNDNRSSETSSTSRTSERSFVKIVEIKIKFQTETTYQEWLNDKQTEKALGLLAGALLYGSELSIVSHQPKGGGE